jgi:DNA-binding Lrp family transcriptional regulator
MSNGARVDATDARILLELARHPRATAIAIADQVGIARNTAHTRLARLEQSGTLRSSERRVDPDALDYPLTAFVTARLTQRRLDEVAHALETVPGILNKRLRAAASLIHRIIRLLAGDTTLWSDEVWIVDSARWNAAIRRGRPNAPTWPGGPSTASAPATVGSARACACT